MTLPPNTTLGNSAFAESGIERVIIPEGYQTIGRLLLGSAMSCRLVDFPSTVTAIGDGLLWAVKDITTIVCRAITPPTFGGFGYNGFAVAIYVPDESINVYKSATNWALQSNKIYSLSQYKEL